MRIPYIHHSPSRVTRSRVAKSQVKLGLGELLSLLPHEPAPLQAIQEPSAQLPFSPRFFKHSLKALITAVLPGLGQQQQNKQPRSCPHRAEIPVCDPEQSTGEVSWTTWRREGRSWKVYYFARKQTGKIIPKPSELSFSPSEEPRGSKTIANRDPC